MDNKRCYAQQFKLRIAVFPGTVYGRLQNSTFKQGNIIDNGMLYQSSYRNNVVFVGFDEKGTARYATMRSINSKRFFCDVSGSDKKFSFRLTQKDAETIHIFESAIDLISYMTIVLCRIRCFRKQDD